MRIQPTASGSKALLLLVVLTVAYFATSYSNLFFLVLAFSSVLGLFGVALAMRNLHGVTAELVDVPMAAAGANRSVRLLLHSRRRAFDLRIELLGDRSCEQLLHLPLLPGPDEVLATLPARPRGVSHHRQLRISSCYPFGFVRISRRCNGAIEVVTHPAPLEQTAAANRRHGHGDAVAAAAARGSSLAGLRPFRTGDAPGDVHWKATARRGTAIVKERECEGERAVAIVLDRRGDAAALERALSQACRIVLSARDAGRRLRLHSQGFDSGPSPTSDSLLRWLAAADTLPASAAAPTAPAGALLLPQPAAAGAP